MSRVTPIPPPVKTFQQITRRWISTSNSAGTPSALLDSRARANTYFPRAVKDLKAECIKRQLKTSGSKSELVERLIAHDIISSSFHTSSTHRPLPQTIKTIPLMQGFRTSAPKAKAHDSSTIDYAFLPAFPEDSSSADQFAQIRVPLLPDNYTPDRSADSVHKLETLDGAVGGAQVNVVLAEGAGEERVVAALSEVIGNEGIDVDINQLTSIFSSWTAAKSEEPTERGIFRELWESVLDDIFGPKKGHRVA